MTTSTGKAKGSQELEAIETIIMLLSKVKSKEGIAQIVEAIESKGKKVLEAELKKAKDKVKEIEKSLQIFHGEEKEPKKEEQEEPTKEAPSTPQENRPVFSTQEFERLVTQKFVENRPPGFEFNMTQVKEHIINELKISKNAQAYNTENGSNLFSSTVRNSLRSMTNKFLLHRVKPGLYATPLRKEKGKTKEEFITWAN